MAEQALSWFLPGFWFLHGLVFKLADEMKINKWIICQCNEDRFVLFKRVKVVVARNKVQNVSKNIQSFLFEFLPPKTDREIFRSERTSF